MIIGLQGGADNLPFPCRSMDEYRAMLVLPVSVENYFGVFSCLVEGLVSAAHINGIGQADGKRIFPVCKLIIELSYYRGLCPKYLRQWFVSQVDESKPATAGTDEIFQGITVISKSSRIGSSDNIVGAQIAR